MFLEKSESISHLRQKNSIPESQTWYSVMPSSNIQIHRLEKNQFKMLRRRMLPKT